jgi:hypothetical protein
MARETPAAATHAYTTVSKPTDFEVPYDIMCRSRSVEEDA